DFRDEALDRSALERWREAVVARSSALGACVEKAPQFECLLLRHPPRVLLQLRACGVLRCSPRVSVLGAAELEADSLDEVLEVFAGQSSAHTLRNLWHGPKESNACSCAKLQLRAYAPAVVGVIEASKMCR